MYYSFLAGRISDLMCLLVSKEIELENENRNGFLILCMYACSELRILYLKMIFETLVSHCG